MLVIEALSRLSTAPMILVRPRRRPNMPVVAQKRINANRTTCILVPEFFFEVTIIVVIIETRHSKLIQLVDTPIDKSAIFAHRERRRIKGGGRRQSTRVDVDFDFATSDPLLVVNRTHRTFHESLLACPSNAPHTFSKLDNDR